MSMRLPPGFNFRSEALDVTETYIRDYLNLNVENWAKFRYSIRLGIDPKNLRSTRGRAISRYVKDAYRDLGNSHYEVIQSLGCAHLSLTISQTHTSQRLLFYKSAKDFYFHIGCLLDNLARLIYVINDPRSASHKTRKRLTRHWIGWGSLGRSGLNYPGYKKAVSSRKIKEIKNLRNSITHSWKIPEKVDSQGQRHWPAHARTARYLAWPYEKTFGSYRKWKPVLSMMDSDFRFIEVFQNKIFGRLRRDIAKFERHYSVRIV